MQTRWCCRKGSCFYSSAKPANQINQTKRSGAPVRKTGPSLFFPYIIFPFLFLSFRAPSRVTFPLDARVTRAVRDKNEKSRSPLIVINSAFIIIKIDRRASRNNPLRPSSTSQIVVFHSASLSVRYNIYKKRTYNTGYIVLYRRKKKRKC